jgi:hypothetical protein
MPAASRIFKNIGNVGKGGKKNCHKIDAHGIQGVSTTITKIHCNVGNAAPAKEIDLIPGRQARQIVLQFAECPHSDVAHADGAFGNWVCPEIHPASDGPPRKAFRIISLIPGNPVRRQTYLLLRMEQSGYFCLYTEIEIIYPIMTTNSPLRAKQMPFWAIKFFIQVFFVL